MEVDDPAIIAVGESRMSGSTNDADLVMNQLKSKLLPNEVMDRYLERVKKL